MVLIVEDEPIARRALTALLSASGFNTRAVTSAEEALQLVQQGCVPRIALIDVDLPGMSGFDLVRRLEEQSPSVIPVLVTATDGERIDAFRQRNPVNYMRKPIDVDGLLAFLKAGQPVH